MCNLTWMANSTQKSFMHIGTKKYDNYCTQLGLSFCSYFDHMGLFLMYYL